MFSKGVGTREGEELDKGFPLLAGKRNVAGAIARLATGLILDEARC